MKPCIIWFTGLSGAGKSTLSEALISELKVRQIEFEYLDGDEIRAIMQSTGFSKDERNQHVRWVGYVATRLERHGIVVVASFVSPYRESRDFVRQLSKNFIEIYVSTSIDECERRDVKGLYKKARAGEIKNFTGVSDAYEPPVAPELSLDTGKLNLDECLKQIRTVCGIS
jgi:adenylylsulfate kinase